MASKASNDYVYLYELLSVKNIEHQPFETISQLVHKKFAKTDHLSVGTLLTLLLRCGDLPGKVQRLVAFYLIFDLFRCDGQLETPFASFFMNLLIEPNEVTLPKVSGVERTFLEKLLSGVGVKEIGKQSPSLVLNMDLQKVPINILPFKIQSIEQQKLLPLTAKATVSNCVPSPTMPNTENGIKDMMAGFCKPNTPLKNVISPQFMTIAPPLLPVEDELVWFNLTNRMWHKPMYDTTLGQPKNSNVETKRLVQLAFGQALSFQDRQMLQNEFNKNPDMVNQIGLTPAKLPNLVENNPLVAIEVLLKLMHSPEITDYFNVLVNMEMSLYSMEVVNRLTNSVDLPTEFVYLYISNCISTCETIKDKFLQTRLVRLLCVFLQSLIRNKIIDVKELFIEVEAFCVEFSRIREATALYRLLKQLEFGDATPTPQISLPSTSGQSK